MGERPGKHIGRRLRARHWRTALVWVAALAALALAAWIATRAALALSGLPAPTTREERAAR
jgi:cyanate permease